MSVFKKLFGLSVLAGAAAGAYAYYTKKKEEEMPVVETPEGPVAAEDVEEDLKALFEDFDEAAAEKADEIEQEGEPDKAEIIRKDLKEIFEILKGQGKVYAEKANVVLKDAAEKAKVGLTETYETVVEKAKNLAEDMGEVDDDGIRVEIPDADDITDAAEDIAGNIADAAEKVADAVADTAEDVCGEVADKAEGIADAAEDIAEEAAEKVGEAAEAVGEKLGE